MEEAVTEKKTLPSKKSVMRPPCAWCRKLAANGRLATVDQERKIEVSTDTVLLCDPCGKHFHGGQARDREGDCRYEFEPFA